MESFFSVCRVVNRLERNSNYHGTGHLLHILCADREFFPAQEVFFRSFYHLVSFKNDDGEELVTGKTNVSDESNLRKQKWF